MPLLTKFGIAFPKVGEVARTGADALGDVAEAVTSLKDPHAQLNFLGQLGISDDLLPLLNKGRKGLDDYLATAQRTGGVMTAEMAENAKKMNTSWVELGRGDRGRRQPHHQQLVGHGDEDHRQHVALDREQQDAGGLVRQGRERGAGGDGVARGEETGAVDPARAWLGAAGARDHRGTGEPIAAGEPPNRTRTQRRC